MSTKKIISCEKTFEEIYYEAESIIHLNQLSAVVKRIV